MPSIAREQRYRRSSLPQLGVQSLLPFELRRIMAMPQKLLLSKLSPKTRRQFLQTTMAAGTILCGAPAFLRGRNLNDKLNIACIGVGGRGAANLAGVGGENIVALCDVSQNAVDKAAAKYPNARKFSDFRRVYDQANDFEAVVVSTCEHTHALATMAALKEGKHIYCEKPLTHNVWEARLIREAAAKAKVTTQMGIQ